LVFKKKSKKEKQKKKGLVQNLPFRFKFEKLPGKKYFFGMDEKTFEM